MRYGYGRISTDKDTQKFNRQIDDLKDAGCEKIYLERVSGTSKQKPELEKLLNELEKAMSLYAYRSTALAGLLSRFSIW